MANVVSALYAPLIHAFSKTTLSNIETGVLPRVIIAPPRDAIPLAVSLKEMSRIHHDTISIFMPPVNRNTSGILNNQKGEYIGRSPLLSTLFDQLSTAMGKPQTIMEMETGIYGTTSKIMAEAMKTRGTKKYHPLKFYGLGPNISFVHGILSNNQEWVAEEAEAKGLVDGSFIGGLMVLLDTMEELGMEKHYQSVEKLATDAEGKVIPVIVPGSPRETEIARVTCEVIKTSAKEYQTISPDEVKKILYDVPKLVRYSESGLPFTLTEAIPSMNSKEKFFESIRSSMIFDYPLLQL